MYYFVPVVTTPTIKQVKQGWDSLIIKMAAYYICSFPIDGQYGPIVAVQ